MMETPSTLEGRKDCPLHRRTPFIITNVSMTQLSVARYCGGCTFNGEGYTYNPVADELIRNDVLKWRAKQSKQARRQAKEEQQATQASEDAPRAQPDLL
jgi:hypothetical protein